MRDLRRGDPEVPVDWDHVHILGWHAEDGRMCLTSWSGDLPMIDVVVLGLRGRHMPVWNTEVPEGATMVRVPDDVGTPEEYARELGGLHAFGWHVSGGVKRKAAE